MGVDWLRPRSGPFTPGKETRYALYRKLGGPPPMLVKTGSPTGVRIVERRNRSRYID